MIASLDHRIARASELAKTYPVAGDLLKFYSELLGFQKPLFAEARSGQASPLRNFPALLELVERTAPAPLADFGSKHLHDIDARQQLLAGSWEGRRTTDPACNEAARFYWRVLSQPPAEFRASQWRAGVVRDPGATETVETVACCPCCGSLPVAGVLRGEGDGAKRSLLCSLCSTEWPFLRVACPHCAERDKDKLPIYTASDFDHVRVDACDTCESYIKSVDLTRNGRAVPAVDELATVALNIWAEDHGYRKLESNLLGL